MRLSEISVKHSLKNSNNDAKTELFDFMGNKVRCAEHGRRGDTERDDRGERAVVRGGGCLSYPFHK